MSKKIKTGIVLFLFGSFLPLLILPFSSEYSDKDNFVWNIFRNIFTGEIVFREREINVVPDRDEELYKEFIEYKSSHQEFKNLPEDELIEKFYEDSYRGKMYRMEFVLKLKKEKIVTLENKISIPYKYIFVSGVLVSFTGIGIIVFSLLSYKKRMRKRNL